MPDLSAPVGALLDVFGPAIKAGLKAMLRTTLGMVVAAVLCAVAAAFLARGAHWWQVPAAILVTLVAAAVAGAVLAMKSALFQAALHGLGQAQLGQKLFDRLFSSLLKIDEAQLHGERGGSLAQTGERMPLAQAETALKAAVARVLENEQAKTHGVRAWLKRKLSQLLMQKIELLTLSRFRLESAQHGGVDLLLVRNELALQVDRLLAAKIRSALFAFRVIALGLFACISLGGALGIAALARRV